MRLVVARCTVDYEGRLEAHLPEAVRLLMVKADGCVSIHSDGGAYKPLNWMTAPNTLRETEGVWEVVNPKGERLVITLHQVLSDTAHDLGVDPGLRKDGVEAHLQELLAGAPDVIEPGLVLVRREYPTAIGPIVQLRIAPPVQLPLVIVADTNVLPAGIGSDTTTPVASLGPLLVTTIVQVIWLPSFSS